MIGFRSFLRSCVGWLKRWRHPRQAQATEAPPPIQAIAAEPPPPSIQPHIFGPIDLGQYGTVVKREEDKWFPRKPRKPRKLRDPNLPRKSPRKSTLLATTAATPATSAMPPLLSDDVGAHIKPPSNMQELERALDLLERTPEFQSGKYHVEAPDGGYYGGADGTYHHRLFPHNDDSGIFYFRGALLDHLDKYFIAINRMRRADPDAYDIYARVGGTLEPNSSLASMSRLPALWDDPKRRPTFGCVSHCDNEPEDDVAARMSYFHKTDCPPSNVEPSKGDVFEVSTYFDEWGQRLKDDESKYRVPKWMKKHGLALKYYVAIEGEEIRLLKTLQTRYQKITRRTNYDGLSTSGCSNRRAGTNGHHGRSGHFTESIPHKVWDYPEYLKDWYEDRCEHYKQHPDKGILTTIERWTTANFLAMINLALAAEYGVRINVSNDRGDTAAFCISPERIAYFFQDRHVVLSNGRPGRIFHVVKPHIRTLANGSELAVKMHFRGLRKFQWGKYSVNITVSGLHHMPMTDFTVPGQFVESIPPDERHDLLYNKQLGKILANHIAGRPLQF